MLSPLEAQVTRLLRTSCWPPTPTPGRKMFQEGWRGSKDSFRVKHVKGNWVALILELGRL